MSGWYIVLALAIWMFLGLGFWLALVSAGVGFLPIKTIQRARRKYEIVRSGRDRRRHRRPGSVDRRRDAVPAV